MTRDEDRLDDDRSAEPGLPENFLAELFRSGRANAIVSWLLVAILGLVLVESVLDFDRLWILFVAVTGLIVLIPPLAHREWRMMLPWEVLVLALAPILVRGLLGGELGTFASYLSIAGLALVITVELNVFTTVRMTHWFAITFVVATTLASAAAWAIARWSADQLLGTRFLSDPLMSQTEANAALMAEFLWVTLAGLVAGVLFDVYFKGRDRWLGRWTNRVINQ